MLSGGFVDRGEFEGESASAAESTVSALQFPEPDLFFNRLGQLFVHLLLRQIPAVYGLVLIEHFIEGYSVRQIAKLQRIPLGTVLSRIFTAKRLLREAWEAATKSRCLNPRLVSFVAASLHGKAIPFPACWSDFDLDSPFLPPPAGLAS